MTVSQAWLAAALEASAEAPNKTERVAMWVAANYPASGKATFGIDEVRKAARIRAVSDVFACLQHLQSADLLSISVAPDGLTYCVKSSHLIDDSPATATSCRCDTKCDTNNEAGGTHYSDTDDPLKGIMYLVASHGSATTGSTPKSDTGWSRAWQLWRELGLGSSKTGQPTANQGQYAPAIKAQANKLVDRFGWQAVQQAIELEAADTKTKGYSYNFSTFVRSHLEGMLQDALNAPQTGQGSPIAPSSDSSSIAEAKRAVEGSETLSGWMAYDRGFIRKNGGIVWQVDRGMGHEVLEAIRRDVAAELGDRITVERGA